MSNKNNRKSHFFFVSGLELLLNIESYEYSGSMTDSLGLAFYISPSSEPHSYLDPTTMLPVYPGMYTTIALNRVRGQMLFEVRDEIETEHGLGQI